MPLLRTTLIRGRDYDAEGFPDVQPVRFADWRTEKNQMAVIDSRRWLPEFLNALGLSGAGVEVGVREGNNAANILLGDPTNDPPVPAWRGSTLHLVDVDLRAAHARFRPGRGTYATIKFHERESVAAAAAFPDRSLDWVYIDADHLYSSVKADIAAWWPKVKEGGLLCGHDYMVTDWDARCFCGVKWAVDDFAESVGMSAYIAPNDPEPSWFVFKAEPVGPSRVTLVSGHTRPGEKHVAAVRRNHEEYCRRWGYQYRFVDLLVPPDRSPHWQKLPVVASELRKVPPGDWVVWTDTDVVFSNPVRPLHRFIVSKFDFVGVGYFARVDGTDAKQFEGWYPDGGMMMFKSGPENVESLTAAYHTAAGSCLRDWPFEAQALTSEYLPPSSPRCLLYSMRDFCALPHHSAAGGGLRGDELAMHFAYGIDSPHKASAIMDTLTALADGAASNRSRS